MKRKVTLEAWQIQRIVETIGNDYEDAGNPIKRDFDVILKWFGVKDGAAAFKIAEKAANRMYAAESKRWQKIMPGHGT